MRILLLFISLFSMALAADSLITIGGPSLLNSEKYRYKKDRHDYYWANFIDAAKLKTQLLRKQQPQTTITWAVYRPSYILRSKEENANLINKIEKLSQSLKVKLLWFDNTYQFSYIFNTFKYLKYLD